MAVHLRKARIQDVKGIHRLLLESPAGEGLVLLYCSGQGELFVNSYGGIVEAQKICLPLPIVGERRIDAECAILEARTLI